VNDELIRKLFDPRMATILSVQMEVLEEIRTSDCDCSPCTKMRAALGAVEAIMAGEADDASDQG